jgi:SAM-dependent methyltransferase
MRVLDVGCGAGDVSFLVAEIVGPTGQVIGIDVDADALTIAERRRAASNRANVTFIAGDLRTAAGHGPFDAAVGRLVLWYQADPTETLRTIAGMLWPNGIVAFQELASGVFAWRFQNLPLLTSVIGWVRGAFASSGVHVNLGWELYWRMQDAGLTPDATPFAEMPLDIGPDSSAFDRWASITRSLAPKIVAYGVATEDEMDLETLGQRLRAEAVAARETVPLFSGLLVGQSARKVVA